MSFASKEIRGFFKIIIFGIIAFGLIYLFFYLLPYVLLIGVVSWFGYKIIKAIKGRQTKQNPFINDIDNISIERKEPYTNGKIIDVDYEEIK